MIDHKLRQQQLVEREYLHLFAENINQDTWVSGVKQRKWPVGARYFYALQEVRIPSEAKGDAA